MPRHVQIADAIRLAIRTGRIPPRNPIPSEPRLQGQYGVARDTVRKAIAILRDEGYVRTLKGMGTFVSDPESWPDRLSIRPTR